MTDIKKLSFEMLCYTFSLNEERLAQCRSTQRQLLDEMKRRREYTKMRHQHDEVDMELPNEVIDLLDQLEELKGD